MHRTASQSCPGVVKFYGSSTEDGLLRIRMQYCEQGSVLKVMRERVNTEPWTLRELLQAYDSLLDTLQQLHAQRIAHRCIDVTNIFVTEQEEFKIGDFGHVKSVPDGQTLDQHSIYGWKPNVSPNLALSQEELEFSIFKEDIWSLGKVFFEMAALKAYEHLNTFPDDTLISKVNQTMQRYNCPELNRLILKMISRDQSLRPMAAECLQELRLIRENLQVGTQAGSAGGEELRVKVPSGRSIHALGGSEAPTPRSATLLCHKCTSTRVLPKLYDCPHLICMDCLKRRIKQEIRIRCEVCGKEAALDDIGNNAKISWSIKEGILNAVMEACEQRKRAVMR